MTLNGVITFVKAVAMRYFTEFGSLQPHLDSGPDPGFFWKTCKIWHYSTPWLIGLSQENLIGCSYFLPKMYIWTRKSQLNFWSHADQASDSIFRLDAPLRKSALSKCSCLDTALITAFWRVQQGLTQSSYNQWTVANSDRPSAVLSSDDELPLSVTWKPVLHPQIKYQHQQHLTKLIVEMTDSLINVWNKLN